MSGMTAAGRLPENETLHAKDAAGVPEELLMSVRVQTPTRIVIEADRVWAVKCETDAGRRTIEPRRLDGIVPLTPGILTLRCQSGDIIEAALDEGILVKTGSSVSIAVRHAIRAEEKESLRKALNQELVRIRGMETDLRTALSDLESRFMRQFAEAVIHD